MDAFDLIVIGGGSGGYTAAIKASQAGLKTALLEEDKIGGVCLHRGCIPTKVLLETAGVLALLRRSNAFGIAAENIRLDYSHLRRRQEQVISTLHQSLRSVIQKQKVEIVQGRGRLLSPTQVIVNGRTLTTRDIVVATGSGPRQLPGLPVDGQRVITSDHALAMSEVPPTVAIIGAGAVGLEFASFYLDMGCQVTLIEMMPQLAPQEDADLGTAIGRSLATRGATVMASARVLSERTRFHEDAVELVVEHDGQEKAVRAHIALVAIGRQGNVEDLGLEEAGMNPDGAFLKVDEAMRTAHPNIYAVGDVIGGLLLAHAAAAEGAVAAQAIAGQQYQPLDYLRVPRVIYTRPQIAAVGLTEEDAKRQGYRVKTHRYSFRYNAMALIKDETEGFAKVLTDAESGDFLGAHVFGHAAVELILEPALAKWLDASTWELAANIRPHPSLSEVMGEAAQMAAGTSIYWYGGARPR
jgi:dihydrolipoamide dehydrogenase